MKKIIYTLKASGDKQEYHFDFEAEKTQEKNISITIRCRETKKPVAAVCFDEGDQRLIDYLASWIDPNTLDI